MYSELRIPIDNEAVLAFWKAQAAEHGHSLEEEISLLISKAASTPPRQAMREQLAALREKIKAEFGVMPDSTELIRQERDSLG